MTVARREAWRVRSRTNRELLTAETPDELMDPTPSWDRIAMVHEALQRLEDPCRALLVALYFDPERPSYAEVARRFGRSIGGIGPLRGRCLKRVRDLMEGVGE